MSANPTSIVHHLILSGIVEHGSAPPVREMARASGLGADVVRTALHDLERGHGLVLHPGTDDVWVVPPFALVPTAFWVENERRGWWASCIWCALGVCALVGGAPRVHTRLGGESEEVVIDASGDELRPTGLVAHFPIPVARAWDNVHRFCGSTLVFRGEQEVQAWCARHGQRAGDVRPLETVRELAVAWYGGHLAPDWEKWTTAEAARIFRSVGLTGETWRLPEGDERF